jgi:hypothetical protein
LLVTLALAGCDFTPERAVRRYVLEAGQSGSRLQVQSETVRVVQTVPWGQDEIVQVTYLAVDPNGQLSECLSEYQAVRGRLGWSAGRGGGGCSPLGGEGLPLLLGSGGHWGSGEGSWSSVRGTVRDPHAVAVAVTWDDGERQQVATIEGYFLAVQGGTKKHVRVEALDAGGQVLFTADNPATAPGKGTQ